ncbi:hypothetical protein TWF281_005082 [Arthrobotrys megalospora]
MSESRRMAYSRVPPTTASPSSFNLASLLPLHGRPANTARVPAPAPSPTQTATSAPSLSLPSPQALNATPAPASTSASTSASSPLGGTILAPNTSSNGPTQSSLSIHVPPWTWEWLKSPITALLTMVILTITFGAGAWASNRIGKSGVDLAKWTICKDKMDDPKYAELKESKVCQELLAKRFDNIKTKLVRRWEVIASYTFGEHSPGWSEPPQTEIFDDILGGIYNMSSSLIPMIPTRTIAALSSIYLLRKQQVGDSATPFCVIFVLGHAIQTYGDFNDSGRNNGPLATAPLIMDCCIDFSIGTGNMQICLV